MKYSEDWITHNLPIWEKVFEPLKGQKLDILEIGSFEGRSAVWLLENVLTHPESTITCIDPYKPYTDLNQYNIKWDEVKQTFLDNTSKWKDKVTLLVEESKDILPILTPESYDVIYVDGGHTASQCLIDGVLSHLLLKRGGMIIFDDYQWAGLVSAPSYPRAAIDAFINCFAEEYDPLFSSYQMGLLKKDML